MQRWVLHVDMDAFYASVEQLTRPTLRGRPVLVGGASGRGVVAGASYEARKFGARSAMPMGQARALIGFGAVTVMPRRAVYAAASKRVFGVLHSTGAVVEQLSIDEAFIEPSELVGAEAAEVAAWAEELRHQIKAETGLSASIGAGSGKQFAKIGSGEAKPDGVFVIPAERQSDLLHPLPVRKLWGIGPVAESRLRVHGIETIGDFASMSERDVHIAFGGAVGIALWQLAQGIDDRPVAPRLESKQISAERTYPRDLTQHAEVEAAIRDAAEHAHRRLLNDGRAARTVTVKLKLANFEVESRSMTLQYATDDWETLHATAMRLVRYPNETGPIRLVGVSFSGLELDRQDVLFPELDREVVVMDTRDEDFEAGVRSSTAIQTEVAHESTDEPSWRASLDVWHPEFGHGWVQGTGHGVVTVRFETRTTEKGTTRSFPVTDESLRVADPLDSLDWQDWLDQSFRTEEN